MEVAIKHSIDITSEVNKLSLVNELNGGSAIIFNQADPVLGEQFSVKEYEHKIFTLKPSNVFNEDILTLIQSPIVDIVGIEVFAYKKDTNKKVLPIRFDVDIRLTGMGSAINMGTMTHFSMQNLSVSKITELHIKTVVVDADKEADLVVLVMSKNVNE